MKRQWNQPLPSSTRTGSSAVRESLGPRLGPYPPKSRSCPRLWLIPVASRRLVRRERPLFYRLSQLSPAFPLICACRLSSVMRSAPLFPVFAALFFVPVAVFYTLALLRTLSVGGTFPLLAVPNRLTLVNPELLLPAAADVLLSPIPKVLRQVDSWKSAILFKSI